MDFDLQDCRIRLAEPSDKAALISVARGIWGGTDYLPKVLDQWIAESWFWICEYRGRAIACLKMTLLPDKVLWFEGLRVKKEFQNRGIATWMNKFCFAQAAELKKSIPGLAYEFCTYYLNVESLHLTQKIGFRVVAGFYDLRKHGVSQVVKPKILPEMDLAAFHNFPDYIPCSWQSLHNCPEAMPYLAEHGCLFQTPRCTYYLGGLHEPELTFLEPPRPDLPSDLPYFQYFFGSRRHYNIIIPQAFRSSLPLLHKNGFCFWENEITENMLVLRM